jgi:hypothetical protein
MHATFRAFMGDKAGVAATVAVGHWRGKRVRQQPTLVFIEPFRCDEHNADAQLVQCHPPHVRLPHQQAHDGRITEQYGGPLFLQMREVLVQPGGCEVEGRQQHAAQEAVAAGTPAVLGMQFDRRAPDDGFAVANVHAPPARCAPFGGDVMADALLAKIEYQRFAAGTARAVALQLSSSVGAEVLAMGVDVGFAQDGQFAQVRATCGIKTGARMGLAIIRDVLRRVQQ